MMVFFLSLLRFFLPSPKEDKPLYNAIYRTEITTFAPITYGENWMKDDDSLSKALAKAILEDMQKKGFTIYLQDRISVYRDSAIILTKHDSEEPKAGLQMKANLSDTVLYYAKQKFYSFNTKKERQKIPEAYEQFYDTGEKETILGYQTKIFISANKSQKVWVTNKLPSLLNPRVRIKNPEGAILRYEYRKEKNTVVSEVESIQKGKEQKSQPI